MKTKQLIDIKAKRRAKGGRKGCLVSECRGRRIQRSTFYMPCKMHKYSGDVILFAAYAMK